VVETYDDPRVDLIRAVLPHTQLAAWYRSLTAYVNGSFGEGFGLHLIEAMACGRPLITADYSGLTAFFDPTVGYAVDHTLVPVENDVYTGRWAEPDDASIVAGMRAVYASPAEARRLGRLSASRATNFTWKASGRKLAAALRKHGFLPATAATEGFA
jgi:glycosyltransferase involved in cell wall biosynthesis